MPARGVIDQIDLTGMSFAQQIVFLASPYPIGAHEAGRNTGRIASAITRHIDPRVVAKSMGSPGELLKAGLKLLDPRP